MDKITFTREERTRLIAAFIMEEAKKKEEVKFYKERKEIFPDIYESQKEDLKYLKSATKKIEDIFYTEDENIYGFISFKKLYEIIEKELEFARSANPQMAMGMLVIKDRLQTEEKK